jgi:4-hydroxyphenylpyruvate dioxygenase
VKVAALWVEDATSAYQETMKCCSFWSQQLKKMNLRSGSFGDLYGDRSCFLRAKLYVLPGYMEMEIQSQLKYIDHMVECRLER